MVIRGVTALFTGEDAAKGCDIRVENGRIAEVGEIVRTRGERCIEGGGLYAAPALVDLHVHLREPGFEHKEDIASGTLAAAAGGFGSVVAMPNTKPVTDNPETLNYVLDRAAKVGSCRVFPAAAITVGQAGRVPVDFKALHEAGAVAFSDDGHPVADSGVMYEAMKICARHDYLIITHPEELSLCGVTINEGRISKRLGLKGTPNIAEDLMIARDIMLAEVTGCRLHVAHISTEGGMRLVREAKARGVRVTCETCPHYFTLTDEDVLYHGPDAKMNPPLRSRADRDAVIAAIADGTVDCITTDHAPHAEREKYPRGKGIIPDDGSLVDGKAFSEAPNGIIGLQTSFALGMTFLVEAGHITLERLFELMAVNPAGIIGREASLRAGADADIVVFSPDENFVLSRSLLRSKSSNTPFMGLPLRGAVRNLVVGGRRVI